ncbi:MAG: cytochrome c biogenesis protein CcdA [Porphyromonas sp.]|nr:cytochrome c biogenesis protein CcdA [Porphyromonas sp.]
MSWKRIMASLVLFLGFAGVLPAQKVADYISWTQTQRKVSDTEAELIFTADIEGGWHLYGTDLPSGGPTPTHLVVDKIVGGELVGKLQAASKPISKYDQIFNMNISYWEDRVVLRQRIKVTDAAKFKFEGALRYMICDDTQCLPPTNEEFSTDAKELGIKAVAAPAPAAEEATPTTAEPTATVASPAVVADSALPADSAAALPVADSTVPTDAKALWTPVIEELKAFGDSTKAQTDSSLLMIFVYGFLGGLVALVTPCVWPMIPMTVSFFLKRTKDRSKSIRDALTYGFSIVAIYLLLGLGITAIFGAGALNNLATNVPFNIAFFLLLIFFAISFFGAFELVLPASWTNKMDQKADSTTGFLSILFMAFTLALVSFSCTGPIIGTLLVQAATMGDYLGPATGMFGFALALALPFALFAIFPSMLQSMPKSGGWLNSVKVTLAFLELALSLKFLSVADLTMGWGILDREVFVALWIVIFALLGLYLLGKLQFAHDTPSEKTSIPGLFLGIISLAFAVYMVPGLWGAPLRAISAFAPPHTTQDFNLYDGSVHAKFDDYETGMAYAKQVGKPVLIDFSGYGCVNCRKMEASVWTNAEVKHSLENDYVLITLMVDDRTKLPEPIEVVENGEKTKLRTVGDKWSYLQRVKFGAVAQPFYIALDHEGKPLGPSRAYDESVPAYLDWLNAGVEQFKKSKP